MQADDGVAGHVVVVTGASSGLGEQLARSLVAAGGAGQTSPAGDVLLGLVDFGNGCAQPGYAGVYTRISSPQILGFVNSGIGRASGPVGTLAKHRKHKKRHRHRHKAH